MPRTVYFNNCIRAIRHTTYGRDNRTPIADAIETVKAEGNTVEHVVSSDIQPMSQSAEETDFRLVFHKSNE